MDERPDSTQPVELHQQITHSLAERMNANMYVLSLVAAVFLPLDFLTGLLAAFGGIPGQSSP